MNGNIALIGATGNVGRKVVELLIQRKIVTPERLTLMASQRSKGSSLTLAGHQWMVEEATPQNFQGFDVYIFTTEHEVSQFLIPAALETGSYVIDSSSFYRLNPEVPLIIPPVNLHQVTTQQKLYAHANCLASPIATVLAPLHRQYPIKRVVVDTYQSTSGAGKAAMDECWQETCSLVTAQKSYQRQHFKRQIAFNVIPQVGNLREDGYTGEEYKIIHEVKKVVGSEIAITATAVRVPVMIGHSISLAVEFQNPISRIEEAVASLLARAPFVKLSPEHYATPVEVVDSDEVWIGRIRRDQSTDCGVHLWLCSDNLRRGAATDAVEICSAVLAL